ncbi:MAG TPA: hypothetical protein VFK42_02485 [Acidimicrobiales bacterium]|nr:hypothetical protein [Acidimicrobiales bacterium]
MSRLRLRRRDERGISIAELVISMMIFSLIGVMAVTGLSSSTRSIGQVDDEVQGLQDLRVVSERLSRDLRQARGIDAASNANQVTIWIDANADYKQTSSETITWHLCRASSTTCTEVGPYNGLYDVLRQDGTGKKSIVGHTLVSNIAFFYDVAPPKTRVVRVDMTYDAMPGRYAKLRTATFEVRLRNVQ